MYFLDKNFPVFNHFRDLKAKNGGSRSIFDSFTTIIYNNYFLTVFSTFSTYSSMKGSGEAGQLKTYYKPYIVPFGKT